MRRRRSLAWQYILGILLSIAVLGGCVYATLFDGFGTHFIQKDTSDWRLLLVNAWNPVPEDYVDTIPLETVENGFQVDARICEDLNAMLSDLRAEGLRPEINSAFRTNAYQQELYDSKVQEYISDGYTTKEAQEQAGSWVAEPGTSEHELGLALDISMYTDDADEVHSWLRENCCNYGFILRYPEDKTEITGISNEPWHYRYVGKETAQEITARDLCLEEYLAERAREKEPAVSHFVLKKAVDWNLALVNRWNPLPENHAGELTLLANGEQVDSRIYPQLQQMFDDARAQGVYPIVASGYRTAEDQRRIMEENIQEYLDQGYTQKQAEEEAQNWVAEPGTSEHQLGFAVDINADGVNSYGYEVYDWLAEHAWEYGFIRRFPEDKTELTGVSNEPWHYRYVGVDAAKAITDQGLCLEEYLEQQYGD